MDGISEQEQPDFEGVKQQLAEAIDKMDEIKVKHNIDEKRHSFALYTKESWILLSMIVMLLASGASSIYHCQDQMFKGMMMPSNTVTSR